MMRTRFTKVLALILALVMTIGLLPMSAMATATTESGLTLDKTVTANSDGSYTLNLEAYDNGSSSSETTTQTKPTDIILVLDQSGSMADPFSTTSTTTYSEYSYNPYLSAYYSNDNIYVNIDGSYQQATVTYTTREENNQGGGRGPNRNTTYYTFTMTVGETTWTSEETQSGWVNAPDTSVFGSANASYYYQTTESQSTSKVSALKDAVNTFLTKKDFDTANLSRKSKIKQNTPRYAAILGNIKGHF
jgi:hypothetical protein